MVHQSRGPFPRRIHCVHPAHRALRHAPQFYMQDGLSINKPFCRDLRWFHCYCMPLGLLKNWAWRAELLRNWLKKLSLTFEISKYLLDEVTIDRLIALFDGTETDCSSCPYTSIQHPAASIKVFIWVCVCLNWLACLFDLLCWKNKMGIMFPQWVCV